MPSPLETVKEWYTTAELVAALDKAEYTVHECCRLGRSQATKKPSGRGSGGEWLISHPELERLRNFGPGPGRPVDELCKKALTDRQDKPVHG